MEFSTKQLLQKATEQKYAVPAICISNLESITAVFRAMQCKKSPVIFQIYDAQKTIQKLTYEDLGKIIRQIATSYEDVPFSIHLDHSSSYEDCKLALDSGIKSVMIDFSSESFEDNCAESKRVKDYAGSSATVEAELGHVGGEEGAEVADVDSVQKTSPSQLKEFIEKTNTDIIAISIGNSHGRYNKEPELDFELLKEIRQNCDIPLVLHGASGIPYKAIKKAIELGISKINYYTVIDNAIMQAAKEKVDTHMLELIQYSIEKIEQEVYEIIELCGSANRV